MLILCQPHCTQGGLPSNRPVKPLRRHSRCTAQEWPNTEDGDE